ncbi:fungal hydrophobin [Paxillus involutus ATCC 200175]|nr:fungal hydrophobin [Paxillus involutus ATCC 200175]
MFIRPSSIVLPIVALAAVATASPSTLEARGGSQCNTGPIQCCSNTLTNSATTLDLVSSLLGLSLPSISGLIGLGCNPITVVGTGTGAVCTQQPVCCSDNTYNGLVNLGCSPINLNL